MERPIPTAEVRRSVLARSGDRCAICGRARTADLEVAHIVPVSEGGTDAMGNLLALCRSCHYALDSNPNTSIDELRGSRGPAYDLERQVAEIFDNLGYAVLTGATGPDAGMDMVVYLAVAGARTIRIGIECISSTRPLTRARILQAAEKATQYGSSGWTIVTDAPLTPSAVEAARLRSVKVYTVASLRSEAAQLSKAS